MRVLRMCEEVEQPTLPTYGFYPAFGPRLQISCAFVVVSQPLAVWPGFTGLPRQETGAEGVEVAEVDFQHMLVGELESGAVSGDGATDPGTAQPWRGPFRAGGACRGTE